MGAYGYLVAFSSAIGGFLFGYDIGVVSQVLSMDSFGVYFGTIQILQNGTLVKNEVLQASLEGWVTFMFLIGAVVGALVVSVMADYLGRRWSIIFGGGIFTIGGFLQSLAHTELVFYGGRVVSGFGIGILSAVVPMYISETSPTEIRGRMITIQQFMTSLGILVASIINAIIILNVDNNSELEWRMAVAVQIIHGVLLMIMMFFMPYSPRWLSNRGRNIEATAIIARLRDSSIDSDLVQTEINEIKSSIEMERQVGSASWSELLRKGIFNRVLIGMTLQFWQQWTGINVILYYQNSLFTSMGIDKKAAAIPFPIANNFVNFMAVFPGMFLVECLGRRKLLIYGGIGIALAHVLLLLFVKGSHTIPVLSWGVINQSALLILMNL